MATVQESMDRLAQLFGATNGTKVFSNCTGKYRGYRDYSVQFDNGVEFFITMGAKHFKEELEERVNLYSNFQEKKQAILQEFVKVMESDRDKANLLGLKGYKVLDIDYMKSGHHIGWFYITIEVEGKVINHMETNTSYAIRSLANGNEVDLHRDRQYFIAGGLDKADYIFNGTGFDSESEIYTVKVA